MWNSAKRKFSAIVIPLGRPRYFRPAHPPSPSAAIPSRFSMLPRTLPQTNPADPRSPSTAAHHPPATPPPAPAHPKTSHHAAPTAAPSHRAARRIDLSLKIDGTRLISKPLAIDSQNTITVLGLGRGKSRLSFHHDHGHLHRAVFRIQLNRFGLQRNPQHSNIARQRRAHPSYKDAPQHASDVPPSPDRSHAREPLPHRDPVQRRAASIPASPPRAWRSASRANRTAEQPSDRRLFRPHPEQRRIPAAIKNKTIECRKSRTIRASPTIKKSTPVASGDVGTSRKHFRVALPPRSPNVPATATADATQTSHFLCCFASSSNSANGPGRR